MKLYRRLQVKIVVPRMFGMITRIWHIITLDYVVIVSCYHCVQAINAHIYPSISTSIPLSPAG